MLGRVVKTRNEFTHGRLGYDDRDVAKIRALFTNIRTFCESPILTDLTSAHEVSLSDSDADSGRL